MRIAIACCGLEHVRRGYESFSRELYDALRQRSEVLLFKGSGRSSPGEIVVPCLTRDFLSHFMNPERAFYWEQITFAIALLPLLFLKRIDVLHYSEGNLGNALARFVRWSHLKVTLVQSNGGPHHPGHFRPEVFIHQVCKAGIEQALQFGIPDSRMTLVPYGINDRAFRCFNGTDQLRQRLGLPPNKQVVLSLAALKKSHKRLDYLIQEVAALENPKIFLCMAGEPTAETDELKELAQRLLPGQHAFLSLPRSEVPALLCAADILAHPALHEGFGMVLIEACSAGVPVVCHKSDHFQWVLGDAAFYADMNKSGHLTAALQQLLYDNRELECIRERGLSLAQEVYSWNVLADRYLEMYDKALHSPLRT